MTKTTEKQKKIINRWWNSMPKKEQEFWSREGLEMLRRSAKHEFKKEESE